MLVRKLHVVLFVSLTTFIVSSTQTFAEDIEIYNSTQKVPNVLFIIDSSGSMDDDINGDDPSSTGLPSKWSLVTTALDGILSESYSNLNVGFMNFAGDNGRGVDFPVADINGSAKSVEPSVSDPNESYSSLLRRFITNLPAPDDSTPITQSLYEAALYYRGENVDYGAQNPGTWNDANSEYTGAHVEAAGPRTYSGGTWNGSGFTGTPRYNSPIGVCTENYIVLLSDGIPRRHDDDVKDYIKELYDPDKSDCNDISDIFSDDDDVEDGECAEDLTYYLKNFDQSSIAGTQTVTTYTIGFALANDTETKEYMESLATADQNGFYDAGNSSQLVTSFKQIVDDIIENRPRAMARVGTTFDLTSLSSSRDEIYVPLFNAEPNFPRWQGNLKGYTFDASGELKGLNGNSALVTDANGNVVFNDASTSYWSTAQDGESVALGGVASRLNATTRNAFTDDGPGTSRTLQSLDTANTSLTGNPAIFGLPGSTPAADIQKLISWTRGFDVYDEDGDLDITEQRNFIGDALHTAPIVASYDGNDTDSMLTGSPAIERVAYFMTNEGFLHAINVTGNTSSDGGNELFAYMPSDLLDNLVTLQNNAVGGSKVYGLDGPLVLYQVGGPTNVAGDKYLYFGMRRGGMNYYAMNVSNPNAPTLMWTIEGGSGDFQELAQTWSSPIVTKVMYDGAERLVLVLGGGYDTIQDTATVPTPDTQGRAIYVVDAVTGQKLWSAGPSGSPDTHTLNLSLTNGIAGDVSAIDLDNDSITDRLYFGDLGGHVWRIDFQGDLKTGTAGLANDYSGYMLADLQGNDAANTRRFFSRPVAARTENGKLAVTIGSGHRSHPLDSTVQNRFYTIYDPNISGVPTTVPSPITESDLQNITDFTTGYTDSSKSGWKINLGTGEKIFNEALVLRGEVFFTTYIPPVVLCEDVPNGSRLFAVDLEGKITRNLDGDITNGDEAYVNILNFGILPKLSLHYGGAGQVNGIFLPNFKNIYSLNKLEDRFWTNNP